MPWGWVTAKAGHSDSKKTVAERPRDASCHWIFAKLLNVIGNDTLEEGVCKSLLVFHCNCHCHNCPYFIVIVVHFICLYLVPFLRYSASNNGVTLKSGTLRVLHGHWNWKLCRSIDHIRLLVCHCKYTMADHSHLYHF